MSIAQRIRFGIKNWKNVMEPERCSMNTAVFFYVRRREMEKPEDERHTAQERKNRI